MGRGGHMPPKIRKLKSDLQKAGFFVRQGKGSHTRWYYQYDLSIVVTVSGKDGQDAKEYQIREVMEALKRAKEQ
jgi:predicted RNA binding protein YcfA (HicA-like mRNA interferase family)